MTQTLEPGAIPRSPGGVAWRGFWSALPDFLLASQFLLMWIDPNIIGARFLPLFIGLMIAEFIVLHSSVVLGNVILGDVARRVKFRNVAGLGALYTLFFLGICLAVGEWYYLFGFWLMIGNRLLGVALGQAPEGEEKLLIQRGWAATTIFYLVGVFLTIILPLPRLGITSQIQSRYSLSGGGEWVDNPHTAIAFGFFYFAMVGWSELLGHRWFASVKTNETVR